MRTPRRQTSIIVDELPQNKYDYLEKLIESDFKTKQTIPQQIENIRPREEDYPELELPNSGLKIPAPLSEIQKANKMADNIIKSIDTNNNRLYNIYKNIISSILKFVKDNDILYVTATDKKYETTERNQFDIRRFVSESAALDKKITDTFNDLQSPISRILDIMKLDNSYSNSVKHLNTFKDDLLEIYRNGLSDIFKLIAIGEGN